MFYFTGLENLILNRHLQNCADELLILSGWVGPSPIQKLSNQIKTTAIIGIKANAVGNLPVYRKITNTTTTDVYVKDIYNHAKIYCWIKNGVPIDILVGSANCTTAGLNHSNGEVLYATKKNDFSKIYSYLQSALNNSQICTTYTPPPKTGSASSTLPSPKPGLDKVLSFNPPKAEICVAGIGRKMELKSGWNWGHGKGNNALDVAEQRIRVPLVQALPGLFPNNGINPNYGKGQAHKNKLPNAEITFDDGTVMDARFEQQSKTKHGVFYKAFCSFPHKNTYGRYVRKRLGLSPTALITDADIAKRGKDTITLELLSPGVYYCDFS